VRLIHRKFAAITTAASKDESRPFLTGVFVKEESEGKVTLAATDGGRLIMVEIPDAGGQDFPAIDGMPTEDNGVQSGIIPAEAFAKVLKANKVKRFMPILEKVAVALRENGEKQEAVLAFTDLEQPTVTKVPIRRGTEFPNYTQVIPDAEKAVFTVSVNAGYLAEVLMVITRMVEGNRNGTACVTMRFFEGPNEKGGSMVPFRLDAEDEDGAKIVAVVAPMRKY